MRNERKGGEVMNIKEIVKLVKQIEVRKNKIAKLRDEMRDLLDNYEDLFQDVDQGIYSFDLALQDFRHGIDEISQSL